MTLRIFGLNGACEASGCAGNVRPFSMCIRLT